MSAPNYPQAPAPAPQARKPKGRGLGIAALILGIISLLFSWIPIVNIVGIIVGVVGIVLGIIGIFISHRVMAIIGAVLALLGIIVAVNVNSAVARALAAPTTVQEQNGAAAAVPGAADTYEYQVTGKGTATVGYGTVSGSGVTSSSGTQTLPWSKTITVDNKGMFFAPTLTATSTNGGSVACKIVHNGKVVADQTASGQYATVACSGS